MDPERRRAWWLRLLPAAFRRRFGDDLADAVHDLRVAARASGGRRAEFRYLAREARDLMSLARTGRGAPAVPWRGLVGDVRWGVRMAVRRPGWTATAVLTIAGAVATLTTAQGVASAVLWRPLPFANASRLVLVWEGAPGPGASPEAFRVTGARFADWRDDTHAFASLALFGAAAFPLETDDGVQNVRGARVSGAYFQTLGIGPVLGRVLLPEDERPGAERVVVLSYEFWQSAFGGRRDVIGRLIRLGGEPSRIVGVMPRAVYPAWPVNPAVVTIDADARQLWVPLANPSTIELNGRAHVFGVVGRLRGSTTMAQAQAELDARAGSGIDRHGARVRPLRNEIVGAVRLPLLVLLVSSIAVLLVAGANLAALEVAQFDARRDEFATRMALGAGAARLARQIAVETGMLAAAGAVVGIPVAGAALARLPGWLPAAFPMMTTPALHGGTLAAGAGAAALLAVSVAAWPVWRLWRGGTVRPVTARARATASRVLIAAQVSVTTALVVAAALLVTSLTHVRAQQAGFTMARVLVASVSLPEDRYRDPSSTASVDAGLVEAVAARADVAGAAFAYDTPLTANWIEWVTIVGAPADPSDRHRQAQLRIVSPGYFRVLQVRVLDGRTFTTSEGLGAQGVAVVNAAFERANGASIGRRLRIGAARATWGAAAPDSFVVIGEVADERFRGLDQPSQPAVYVSTRQFPLLDGMLIAVARQGEPDALAPEVRAAVRRVEARATFDHARPLAGILADQLAPRRITARVVTAFSAGALALALLGVYGLLRLLVVERRREIGIRIALGAPPGRVARGILVEACAIAGGGVAAGLVIAVAAGRALDAWLFGVSSANPALLTSVAAALLAASVAAALPPARRAARTDPVAAMRNS
ncbi:MAG TPA: ABC transporter permease [Vicinamibacterales bacterium]|nr:ABC transporter permease [Vicinamibacterales bacterium]